MFNENVLKPFLEMVENFGLNNAFCINETFYSYEQFGEYVSKIKEEIINLKEDVNYIGLVVNDDIDTYASIFALWLEGKAYIPLHPKQPKERNMEIIYQMGISNILDSSKDSIYKGFTVTSTQELVYKTSFLDIKNDITEDKLAYILFTSGSTGKPKGVMISRKNVGAFMKSFWETGIVISENDRCLQTFDLTFDVSVQSFLTPLTKGACVFTVPHNQIKYSYVFGLLEDHQITFGAIAPSMLRYLKPYFNEIDLPNMKYCIVTAEASPLDLINEWQKCIPNAIIYDFYGPTEATIYCTYYQVKQNESNKTLNGMLSIGKSMPGLKVIITDEEGKILGTNQKGELCISGNQLTPGYWKNPKKNKESFFEVEIDGTFARFYKTGDSCYFDDDGDIMLAGRLDYQVKIQGYRIELGEIEYHATEFVKGQNAIACTFDNQMGNTEIALFVEGELNDEEALIAFLSSKMPFYMIPTKILAESIFPLNTSGKVDRLWLKNRIKK